MTPSEPNADRRVMITGASGFIGSRLVDRLVGAGQSVTIVLADWVPDSHLIRESSLLSSVNVRVGRVEDFGFLQQVIARDRIDTVYHLAAVATEGAAFGDPLAAFETNIRGTYNLLEACRRSDGQVERVVVASSDKAYGEAAQLPYVETMAMNGRNPYDVSKSCADLLARAYAGSYGLPAAVGRYGNVFGPGDLDYSRLIPGTIRRLHNDEAPLVKKPADGEFARDYLYIEDAVDSYLAMSDGLDARVAVGQAYNFAMGVPRSPLHVVNELRRLMGKEHLAPHIVEPRHGEILHQHISIDKARRQLGWAPKWSLADGLIESVGWYSRHLAGGVAGFDRLASGI